jgi:hypothetical protein
MQYEMKNFIKTTKRKASNVGQSKYNDDWKRDRDMARKKKVQMQRGVTDYKSKRIA